MNHLHSMRVLIRVVELACFAQAAEQLGISLSSATRGISMLENHLHVRLLNRSNRKISLTDVGREYIDSARAVIEQVDGLESSPSRANRQVRGTLCSVAPTTFAECGLFALVAAYQKAHPQVFFDVTTCEGTIELIPGGYDVGFAAESEIADSTLECRELITLKEILVASPSYLTRSGLPPLAWSTQYPSVTFSRLRYIPPHLEVFGIRNVSQRGSEFRLTCLEFLCNSGRRNSTHGDRPVTRIAGERRLAGGCLILVLSQFEVCGKRRRVSVIYAGRSYVATEVRNFLGFAVGQYRDPGIAPALCAIA